MLDTKPYSSAASNTQTKGLPMIDPALNLATTIQEFLKSSLKSEKLTVLPLAGDASSRHYYRIVEDDSSWVLMAWEPFKNDGTYPFLSVLEHFQKHDVQVPKVVAIGPAIGAVLLEDLGDLTLERKFWENQNQQLALPFYRQAIDELIKIHFACSLDKTDCTAFKIEFNTERLLWEMNYGREHLLEKMCEIKIDSRTGKELDSLFHEICERLDREPKFICHRDYHSRNLMLKLGKMRVIDFQDARMGPIQYDLVSLLKDAYVDIAPEIAKEILAYYHEQSRRFMGEATSIAHFEEIYELQSIQRCFKACGSFASFFNLRSDTRYLKYLPASLQRVRAALERFPKYRTFFNVLHDNGLFEKTFEAK